MPRGYALTGWPWSPLPEGFRPGGSDPGTPFGGPLIARTPALLDILTRRGLFRADSALARALMGEAPGSSRAKMILEDLMEVTRGGAPSRTNVSAFQDIMQKVMEPEFLGTGVVEGVRTPRNVTLARMLERLGGESAVEAEALSDRITHLATGIGVDLSRIGEYPSVIQRSIIRVLDKFGQGLITDHEASRSIAQYFRIGRQRWTQ